MTIYDAYSKILKALCTIYDNREAANIADWVFENVTRNRKIDRIVNKNLPLNTDHENKILDYTKQLLEHKPVQYVLNEAWFAGLKLYVDECVLIPRPETEELVDWIVTDIRSTMLDVRSEETKDQISNSEIRNPTLSIIDIGTGSGCIPLALKKKLGETDISAIDVSEEALNVARKNALANKLEVHFSNINFLDRHQWKSLNKYDFVVSNPPYIKQSEKTLMSDNVLKYEPRIALFVPDEDALVFYQALAEFGQTHLNDAGNLFVEINENLGQQVVELFKKLNFINVELRKDLQGKDRMVKAGYSNKF